MRVCKSLEKGRRRNDQTSLFNGTNNYWRVCFNLGIFDFNDREYKMRAITKQLKATIIVENMVSNAGNDVPNQFIIITDYGRMFRSYGSNIVFIPNDEDIIYLGKDYNYSRTTSKYRNQFLNMNLVEIKQGIKDGTIKVIDL